MLTTWFQKKAAPVRVEVKRQSIRLYPPLPAAEENNIIPMPGAPEWKEGQVQAYAAQNQWENPWQDAVAS